MLHVVQLLEEESTKMLTGVTQLKYALKGFVAEDRMAFRLQRYQFQVHYHSYAFIRAAVCISRKDVCLSLCLA